MNSEFRIYSTKSELKKILKNLKESSKPSPPKKIPLPRSKTPTEKNNDNRHPFNGKRNLDSFNKRNKSNEKEQKSFTPSKTGKNISSTNFIKNKINISKYGVDTKQLFKIARSTSNCDELIKSEYGRKIESHEKPIEMKNEIKKQRVEKDVYKVEKLFEESSKKIVDFERMKSDDEEFKKEVSDLIILIKQEKQVILNDLNTLVKQKNKYKQAYLDLKSKIIPNDSPIIHSPEIEIISSSKQIQTTFMQNEENNIPFQDSVPPQMKQDSFNIENSELLNDEEEDEESGSVKVFEEMGIQTDPYSDLGQNFMDEEKIISIGQLLTTMNMDNQGDESIMNTLKNLNKDDFIELQQLIIQKLVENFQVEKNEKEIYKEKFVILEKETSDKQERLKDRIKILEAGKKSK